MTAAPPPLSIAPVLRGEGRGEGFRNAGATALPCALGAGEDAAPLPSPMSTWERENGVIQSGCSRDSMDAE